MTPTIRCSSLDRVLSCPASMLLADIVAERDRAEPLEGKMGHWLIADKLVRECGAAPPVGGLPPPDVPAGYEWPEESQWLVDYCFNTAKQRVPKDWSFEVEVPLAYEFGFDEPKEITVVEWVDGQPCLSTKPCEGFVLSGHIDALAVNADGTAAIAFDWKTGYIPVEAAEYNQQVLGYIVLLKRAYPNLEEVEFHIVQPRNDPDDGYERDSKVLLGAEGEVAACVDQLVSEVSRCLDNLSQLNCGIHQCKYCPVGIQCPAIREEIRHMLMTLTPQALGQMRREPDDNLLGEVVHSARTIKGAIDEAEEILHERLDKAQSITTESGIRITRTFRPGKYKPLNPPAILSGLRAIAPDNEVANVLDFSTSRMKAMIATSMGIPKTGKAAMTAASVFDERFRQHFEQGTSKILNFSRE